MHSDIDEPSKQVELGVETASSHQGSGKMRVILLTHGGAEDVLNYLVALEEVVVVGVFVETEITPRRTFLETLKRSIRYNGYTHTIKRAIQKLLPNHSDDDLLKTMESRDELQKVAVAHRIPFHLVNNYHTPQSIELLRSTQPDLGVIYGTNIVKESVFRIPRLGSINLHQGLVPFYRGGPPVFWELYNGESEVGLTVHVVETKVDSGEVILQERVPLSYDYTFGLDYESFIKDFGEDLRHRSAQLVAEAVRQIALGVAKPQPQDTSLGKRYRLPLSAEKKALRRRLRERQKVSGKEF